MSEVIRDVVGYRVSRDYRLVWELARRQGVVCVVDYTDGARLAREERLRDVCATLCIDGTVHLSVRGCCYVSAGDPDVFARFCDELRVEWIVPRGWRVLWLQVGQWFMGQWQHEETGRLCWLPVWRSPGRRWARVRRGCFGGVR